VGAAENRFYSRMNFRTMGGNSGGHESITSLPFQPRANDIEIRSRKSFAGVLV